LFLLSSIFTTTPLHHCLPIFPFPRKPSPPPRSALFPYTTLFRSDVWLASLLHRSVLLNGAPVTVLAAAVADTPGISSLHFSEEGKSSNSLLGAGPAVSWTTCPLLKRDRKSTRLNSSHVAISYAVF